MSSGLESLFGKRIRPPFLRFGVSFFLESFEVEKDQGAPMLGRRGSSGIVLEQSLRQIAGGAFVQTTVLKAVEHVEVVHSPGNEKALIRMKLQRAM